MPTAYAEFDSTPATLMADVKAKILLSSDWAELTVSDVALTTLTAASAVAAQTMTIASTSLTLPGLSIGDTVVIDKGLSTEERLTITSRNSLTQLSFSLPGAIFAHSSSATVKMGNLLVKATTTAGAQMVVDLAGGSRFNGLAVMVYRTHDGTTGVDKTLRHVNSKIAGTATSTDVVHAMVSAGKEHLFISLEGPRAGETNADSTTSGSLRSMVGLFALVPYFTTDTNPVVVLVGSAAAGPLAVGTDPFGWVSRNVAGTSSWVPVRISTFAYPVPLQHSSLYTAPMTTVVPASGNGETYFWPFVIVETGAGGLRGRLMNVLHAGYNTAAVVGEPIFTPGQRFTVDGVNYITAAPVRGSTSGIHYIGLGASGPNNTNYQQIVLVPT